MSTPDMRNIVADWPGERAKCRPVPLGHVQPSGFLGERIARNLDSLLAGLESPIPRGFEARARGQEPPPETNRLAADSDLYKWFEARPTSMLERATTSSRKQLITSAI